MIDPYMVITLAIMVAFVVTFAALAIAHIRDTEEER